MNLLFKLKKQPSYLIMCSILQLMLVLPSLAQDIKYLDFLKSVNENILQKMAIETKHVHDSEEDSINYFLNILSHNFKLKSEFKRKHMKTEEIKGKILEIIEDKKVQYTFGKISALVLDSNANLKLKKLIYFSSIVDGVFFIDLQQNNSSLLVVSDWNALNFRTIESQNATNTESFSQDFIIEDYNLAICEKVLKKTQPPQQAHLILQLHQSLGQEATAPQQQVGISASSGGQAVQQLAGLLYQLQAALAQKTAAPNHLAFLEKYECFKQVQFVKKFQESGETDSLKFAISNGLEHSDFLKWERRVRKYDEYQGTHNSREQRDEILSQYEQLRGNTDFDLQIFCSDHELTTDRFFNWMKEFRSQEEHDNAKHLHKLISKNEIKKFVDEYKQGGEDSPERMAQFCADKKLYPKCFSHWLKVDFSTVPKERTDAELIDIYEAYKESNGIIPTRAAFSSIIKVKDSTLGHWFSHKNPRLKRALDSREEEARKKQALERQADLPEDGLPDQEQ